MRERAGWPTIFAATSRLRLLVLACMCSTFGLRSAVNLHWTMRHAEKGVEVVLVSNPIVHSAGRAWCPAAAFWKKEDGQRDAPHLPHKKYKNSRQTRTEFQTGPRGTLAHSHISHRVGNMTKATNLPTLASKVQGCTAMVVRGQKSALRVVCCQCRPMQQRDTISSEIAKTAAETRWSTRVNWYESQSRTRYLSCF